MRIPLLALTFACALSAQDAVNYQFSLRANQGGSTLRDQGADQGGGGGGFAMILGAEPLRLRVRMDGDNFPGKSNPINTYGIGAEALLVAGNPGSFHPYLSAGPAFEQWKIGAPDGFSSNSTVNKLAWRVEGGVWYKQALGLHVGVLTGLLQSGQRVTFTYIGLSVFMGGSR